MQFYRRLCRKQLVERVQAAFFFGCQTRFVQAGSEGHGAHHGCVVTGAGATHSLTIARLEDWRAAGWWFGPGALSGKALPG